jgi:hypothetical protein
MPDDRMSRGYARSRERNEAARAALEPLRPGERPRAVTIAAIVSAALAVLLFVRFAIGGDDVDDERNGILLFGLVLAVAAAGMWKAQYWAVLGFQFFLGLSLVFAGVSLLFAGNLLAVVYCLLILGLAGTLFWYLVKAMARIQMPKVKRPE